MKLYVDKYCEFNCLVICDFVS